MSNLDPLPPDHLQAFLAAEHRPQTTFGRSPTRWAMLVADRTPAGLDDARLRRADLHALRDAGASPEDFFLAVMAWGGMKIMHGRDAWAARRLWLAPLTSILRAEIDRQTAYEHLSAQPIRGMGPAFFTKLIHFGLGGAQPGYIMDQWTAKSVNLIEGQRVIELTGDAVSRRNTAQTYEAYCRIVENLALRLEISPTDTEERLFSSGGRAPQPWRAHVKRHYKPHLSP